MSAFKINCGFKCPFSLESLDKVTLQGKVAFLHTHISCQVFFSCGQHTVIDPVKGNVEHLC